MERKLNFPTDSGFSPDKPNKQFNYLPIFKSVMKQASTTGRPGKEHVRKWLDERRRSQEPLPDIEQLRRQLGWELDAPACESLVKPQE